MFRTNTMNLPWFARGLLIGPIVSVYLFFVGSGLFTLFFLTAVLVLVIWGLFPRRTAKRPQRFWLGLAVGLLLGALLYFAAVQDATQT